MSPISNLLQLSLITGDEFPLLVAAQLKKEFRLANLNLKFNFDSFDNQRSKMEFRFNKMDIPRLQRALGIPAKMECSNRIKFSGLEGLCILLRRLAYPQRLCDLQRIFGRSMNSLSRIFNTVLLFIYQNHSHLVSSLNHWWLDPRSLQRYSQAITAKGCPLTRCFGFIDGTVHKICRPTYHQREFYSGHKRVHGIKYQSVVLPNGIIASLLGNVPARRHDSYMLGASGLMQMLQNHFAGAGPPYYLYGDSGYPLKQFLIKPYQGHQLSAVQQNFNRTMSELRVCVEWEFGDLFKSFAFLDFK